MELTCPKCHGVMHTYERNGVHVDQCTDCRGIFLDRGELEHLVDAENTWHGRGTTPSPSEPAPPAGPSAPPAAPAGQAPPQGGTAQQLGAMVSEVMQQARTQRQTGQHGHQYGYPHKKKKSFLDELFG
jgi:Zn-finger nucleic acid-binding protein